MAASPNGDDQRAPAPAPFTVVVKDGKEELLFPPGYYFAPTEDEVISFLKRKILGEKTYVEIIPTIDVYKYNPFQMPLEEFKYGQEYEWYFYTTRPEGDEFVVEEGFWAPTMSKEIQHEGEVIGYKQTIHFVNGVPPDVKQSNWVIYEYRINPDSFEAAQLTDDIKEKIKNFVVCKVTCA